MLSFFLSFLSLYVSLKALNLGLRHARKSQLEKLSPLKGPPGHFLPHEVELYLFLTSDEMNELFHQSVLLFEDATNQAKLNEEFGHLSHSAKLSTTLYHYSILLTIEPSSITWEVIDNIQDDSKLSKRVLYMHYDRSQKQITEEEVRLNRGDKYHYCSLFEMNKYIQYPQDFRVFFNQLNDAGWNKIHHKLKGDTNQSVSAPQAQTLINQCNKLSDKLSMHSCQMDKEVKEKIESILSIVHKICLDDAANEFLMDINNSELFHTISRLLESELPKILHIHLQLDKTHQEETRDMTVSTLEKALKSLTLQYTQCQQKHIQLLKQTELLMKQRYEI